MASSMLPCIASQLNPSAASFQSVFLQAPSLICVCVRCCFSSVSSFSGCRVPQGRFITKASCKHGKVPACPSLVRWWLWYGKVQKLTSSLSGWMTEFALASSVHHWSQECWGFPRCSQKQTHTVLMQTFLPWWSLWESWVRTVLNFYKISTVEFTDVLVSFLFLL